MLRWIAVSAVLAAVCVALGCGQIVALAPSTQSFFLAMAALAATVLVSSSDAYETQASDPED